MFIDYKLDHTVDIKESSLRTSLGSEICADALIHCNWEKKRSKQSDKEINRSLSFSHISDVNLMIIISFYYIVLCPLLSCPCTSLHHSKGTSTSIRLWSSRRTVGETSKQTVSFSFSSSVSSPAMGTRVPKTADQHEFWILISNSNWSRSSWNKLRNHCKKFNSTSKAGSKLFLTAWSGGRKSKKITWD